MHKEEQNYVQMQHYFGNVNGKFFLKLLIAETLSFVRVIHPGKRGRRDQDQISIQSCAIPAPNTSKKTFQNSFLIFVGVSFWVAERHSIWQPGLEFLIKANSQAEIMKSHFQFTSSIRRWTSMFSLIFRRTSLCIARSTWVNFIVCEDVLNENSRSPSLDHVKRKRWHNLDDLKWTFSEAVYNSHLNINVYESHLIFFVIFVLLKLICK